MTARGPSRTFSEWVEKTIADPASGSRLPTIRQLSRDFGLSESTVHKCLRACINDGRLTAIRGRGLFITSRMPQPVGPAPRSGTSSSLSIADALMEDIAAGKLKHGEALPAVKLLSRQFKAGQASVTDAYRILQQRGLVRRVGKKFWVGGLQSIRDFGARSTVVCLNFSEGDPTDLTSNSEILHAFEFMEDELHNHRLSMRFEDSGRMAVFFRPRALQKTDIARFVITGVTSARLQTLFPQIRSLETFLSRSGKRILVCGQHSDKGTERRLPKYTDYFCHGTIITNVVRTAAEYCFRKGFQNVVLVHRETENNTKDMRFYLRFISELLVRNPNADITFLIRPLHGDTSPEQVFRRTPAYRQHKHFEYLEGLLSKYAPYTLHDLHKRIRLGPTVNDLLSHAPRGAVWICREAAIACAVDDWCTAHRIPVPSEAAILCFEKEPSLHFRGIAACIPDWRTIGYILAHSLIGDIPLRKSRKGFLRTPAVLYERRTMP